ncbi:PilN domain-containing protein [Roseisolibacter sp. H3M3-2]|uniref:PilN domain-containing protein n=1 Tax=Roseisolibacter sp. H3M3-2 TaxID=3031323 RepID=UPI0023D9A073|nr:PilN domain-containing protein [Roseisolibacter sp. H3M3-2]MDF1505456.1 PilN domain-containing protein [Roseisolibacter sp. H3M3-2]
MIIEVNLLPGRQKKRGGGAPFGGLADRLRVATRDRYLTAAVGTLTATVLGVGALHTLQTRDGGDLAEREAAAVADSTRYSSVIKARREAVAERDSVERQLAIIAAIDSNRYVWAHVLDEVSSSLPPYTWLVNVRQTSAAPTPKAARVDSTLQKKDAPPARPGEAKPDTAADGALRFRLVGQTVDIQALTTYMRDLELSPFVHRVQLAESKAVAVDGRDLTEFTLDGEFEQPARGAIRTRVTTVPLR